MLTDREKHLRDLAEFTTRVIWQEDMHGLLDVVSGLRELLSKLMKAHYSAGVVSEQLWDSVRAELESCDAE